MNKINYDKWVGIVKDKSLAIRHGNLELMRRIEPQVRDLKETMHCSLASSAPEWMNKWIFNSESMQSSPLEASSNVIRLEKKLQPLLGQELFCSDWIKVDQRQIDTFAEVTHDQQWIHVDSDRAQKESPYRSTVAHGMLILSLIPHLRSVYDDPLYRGARLIVNQGFGYVRFHNPVKVGQEIRVRSKLSEFSKGRKYIDLIECIAVERKLGSCSRIVSEVEALFRVYL